MNKSRIISLFIGCLLLVILFLVSCGDQGRQMSVVMIQGEPEILRKDTTEWKPLLEGSIINAGDQLRTGENEYIWMEINDGSVVGLGKETLAGLVTLSRSMTNPVTLIDLSEGMFFVTVTKALGKGSFKVQTPIVTGSVVGSKMAVNYDKSKSTAEIACLEGTVEGEYGDDTKSPQVDSGYILGLSIGTIEKGFNADIYKARPADEVYNEFSWFDSRYKSPYDKTWDPIYTGTSLTQTQLAINQTKQARITPSLTLEPTNTSMLPPTTATVTPTPKPGQVGRPTIMVGPNETLSPEEAANSGWHDYNLAATYSGECYGAPTGFFPQMFIEFEGNQVTLSSSGQESVFYKVDSNTYQGVDPEGSFVNFIFTSTGFTGGVEGCYEGVYTRN